MKVRLHRRLPVSTCLEKKFLLTASGGGAHQRSMAGAWRTSAASGAGNRSVRNKAQLDDEVYLSGAEKPLRPQEEIDITRVYVGDLEDLEKQACQASRQYHD